MALLTTISMQVGYKYFIKRRVIDFIQGRVPQRVGAKHYLALARQASEFYPRYLEYVENLRRALSANSRKSGKKKNLENI